MQSRYKAKRMIVTYHIHFLGVGGAHQRPRQAQQAAAVGPEASAEVADPRSRAEQLMAEVKVKMIYLPGTYDTIANTKKIIMQVDFN